MLQSFPQITKERDELNYYITKANKLLLPALPDFHVSSSPSSSSSHHALALSRLVMLILASRDPKAHEPRHEQPTSGEAAVPTAQRAVAVPLRFTCDVYIDSVLGNDSRVNSMGIAL